MERCRDVVGLRDLGERLDLVVRHTRRVLGLEVDREVAGLEVFVAHLDERVDLLRCRLVVDADAERWRGTTGR